MLPGSGIHIGGEDHIAVHHSNEIAQCQARHDTQMANYWMHGYFLQIDNEKVAKSGKSLTLQELIKKGFEPITYRYLVLTAHYRTQLNFTWESLEGAKNALNKLKRAILSWPDNGMVNQHFLQRFTLKINEDLNFPQALAVVWELYRSDLSDADKKATMFIFDQVLGLNLAKVDIISIPEEIIELAENRQIARENSDWLGSDRLRDEILKGGFLIEDLNTGYRLVSKS